MSIIPKKYDLPDHYSGSTLSQFEIKFNFDITGYQISAYLRQSKNIPPVLRWSDYMTIVDLQTGHVIFNSIDNFSLKKGIYYYDVELKSANNNQTFLRGQLNVIEDIT